MSSTGKSFHLVFFVFNLLHSVLPMENTAVLTSRQQHMKLCVINVLHRYFTPQVSIMVSMPDSNTFAIIHDFQRDPTALTTSLLQIMNNQIRWSVMISTPDAITLENTLLDVNNHNYIVFTWLDEEEEEDILSNIIVQFEQMYIQAVLKPRSRFFVVVVVMEAGYHMSPSEVALSILQELWNSYKILDVLVLMPDYKHQLQSSDSSLDKLVLFTWFPLNGLGDKIVLLNEWVMDDGGIFSRDSDLFPVKIPFKFNAPPIRVATFHLKPANIQVGSYVHEDFGILYNFTGSLVDILNMITQHLNITTDNRLRSFGSCLVTIWSVFLGVSVPQQPSVSVLRFIFITFVFFSLTISTVFQAFFTSFLIEPGVTYSIRTLEEMLESGIEYGYARPASDYYFPDKTDSIAKRIMRDGKDCSDYEKCLWRTINKGDYASLRSEFFVEYFVATKASSKTNRVCSLDSPFITYWLYIYIAKGSPLLLPFNRIIRRMMEIGLCNKMWKDMKEKWKYEKVPNFEENTEGISQNYFAFTTQHFCVGFYVIIFGYVLSTAEDLPYSWGKHSEESQPVISSIENRTYTRAQLRSGRNQLERAARGHGSPRNEALLVHIAMHQLLSCPVVGMSAYLYSAFLWNSVQLRALSAYQSRDKVGYQVCEEWLCLRRSVNCVVSGASVQVEDLAENSSFAGFEF
ncbi:hypothetical protein ANN_03540 [Periplaneta americana]|uniref:Uncharacterized protein n=1 Tax=Periplaneta americana TaxID=6978 RepID=A0ABQ8U288_PERAM|nr:hypothetical protein ANN_03540 [Periplaneta americana]